MSKLAERLHENSQRVRENEKRLAAQLTIAGIGPQYAIGRGGAGSDAQLTQRALPDTHSAAAPGGNPNKTTGRAAQEREGASKKDGRQTSTAHAAALSRSPEPPCLHRAPLE
jgi:hypothetical protein